MLESVKEIARIYARDRKERLGTGSAHFLLVIRDGLPIAVLSSTELNQLLGLAETVATGYGADGGVLVVEGVFPLVKLNPITGEPWQRGEAEQVWLKHDGAENGWVSETQILAMALRSGETADEVWPFRLGESSVTWGDAPLSLSSTGLAQALNNRMQGPVIDDSRVPDPGDGLRGDPDNGPFYSREYGRVALDIGITRVLANELAANGSANLIVESDERAEYLVGEGLQSWNVEVFPTSSAS